MPQPLFCDLTIPVQIWSEMTELVSSNNNYSCYRKAFNECQGFKIPILGVHLKDLIAVHVVFPDWVDDTNKVNLVKMQQLYMTFNELVSLQSAVAQVEPNMDLIYLLTVREHHSTGGVSKQRLVSVSECLAELVSTLRDSPLLFVTSDQVQTLATDL